MHLHPSLPKDLHAALECARVESNARILDSEVLYLTYRYYIIPGYLLYWAGKCLSYCRVESSRRVRLRERGTLVLDSILPEVVECGAT